MKTKVSLLIVAVVLVAVVACKKENDVAPIPAVTLSEVQVTHQNSGTTISLSSGQILKIDLTNPGNGGYLFDDPVYDSSSLTLKGHTHTPSANPVPGSSGSDMWEFKALKPSTSTITITATRPFDKNNPITEFAAPVIIK